jgi:hypothetical protein
VVVVGGVVVVESLVFVGGVVVAAVVVIVVVGASAIMKPNILSSIKTLVGGYSLGTIFFTKNISKEGNDYYL